MQGERNGLWASAGVLPVMLDRAAATPYGGLLLLLDVQSSRKKDRT